MIFAVFDPSPLTLLNKLQFLMIIFAVLLSQLCNVIIRRIRTDADRRFVMVTPSIFCTFSRDMSGSGCGSVSAILRLEFQRQRFNGFFFKMAAVRHPGFVGALSGLYCCSKNG